MFLSRDLTKLARDRAHNGRRNQYGEPIFRAYEPWQEIAPGAILRYSTTGMGTRPPRTGSVGLVFIEAQVRTRKQDADRRARNARAMAKMRSAA